MVKNSLRTGKMRLQRTKPVIAPLLTSIAVLLGALQLPYPLHAHTLLASSQPTSRAALSSKTVTTTTTTATSTTSTRTSTTSTSSKGSSTTASSSSSQAGASPALGSGSQDSYGSGGRLCSGTAFVLGDKEIASFNDLSKYFSYYSLIPKLGSHDMVAVELTTRAPCGAFVGNATYYVRTGVRDVKQFKRVFHSQVLRFTRQLFKGSDAPRRILDLGAHTGMTTAYLASTFPRAQVVALEPSLQEFALLRLNTAALKNVRVEYGAAWDKQATVKLTTRGSSGARGPSAGASASSSSASSGPDTTLWHRFVVDVMEMTNGRLGDIVPSYDVGTLMERYGWPDVDLLHADLEGAERVVFGDPRAKDTWLKSVRCIALRLAPDQTPSAMSKLLGQAFLRRGKNLDVHVWCRPEAGEVGAVSG